MCRAQGKAYRLSVVLFVSLFGAIRADTAQEKRADQTCVECSYSMCSDGCKVERVVLESQEADNSENKIVREGVLHLYKGAKATVLISHGFMCSKEDVAFLRHMFPRGKYNVMTFDFRAHGKRTDGQYCTFGHDEAHDVMAAARYLRNHPAIKHKPLLVYGFSMGAVASIEAQARDGSLFDAMVLDCPFDSSETVIKKSLEKLKVAVFGYEFDLPGKGILEQYAFQPYVQAFLRGALKTVANMDTTTIPIQIQPFSPAESIKKVSIPCFFIHCKNDEKVPVASVKSIFDGAAGYKKLWITNGRRHFDSFFYNPEHYVDQVRSFIEQVMSGTLAHSKEAFVVEDPDEDRVLHVGL